MQQLSFPDAVAAVQLARLLQRLLHILLVIHVHGGLKKETLRVRILSRTVVVPEPVVVDGTDRQLLFQCLSCLLHRLHVAVTNASYRFLTTYLFYHSLQPVLGCQAVVDRQRLGRVESSHIAPASRIQCHYLYCSHATSSLKCLALPLISSTSL